MTESWKIFMSFWDKKNELTWILPTEITIKLLEIDAKILQRNSVALTQSYHAVYQFQDDRETCSPDSMVNEQIWNSNYK